MTQNRKELYSPLVKKICTDVGIDLRVFTSIIEVESSWDPYAARYEPNFTESSKPNYWAEMNGITEATERQFQRISWGLGQIMGATARGCGFKGPMPSLCDPETGLFWAATYFTKKCARYTDTSDRIASYNGGSAIRDFDGEYENQDYVDRVKKVLSQLP